MIQISLLQIEESRPSILRGQLVRSFVLCIMMPLLVFQLFSPVQCLSQNDIDVIETADVTVYFDPQLDNAARNVVSMYPAVSRDLERRFKWRLSYRPTIVLIKERKTFENMIGSNLFVAIAIPQRKCIVIDSSRKRHPFTLQATVKHELCHLLLHDYIRTDTLPRWFDEGLAQWSSGGLAEIIMRRDRFILQRAALTGHYIRLENLHRYFPRNEQALLLAYEESKNIVEYMLGEYGIEKMRRILHDLKDGHDIDTALSNSLSLSLHDLEDRWQQQLKQQTSWFSFVSVYFDRILFFLAALLALLGFIRLMIRRRNYQEIDDPDDKGHYSL